MALYSTTNMYVQTNTRKHTPQNIVLVQYGTTCPLSCYLYTHNKLNIDNGS